MFNRRIPKVCLVHVAAAENEWSGGATRTRSGELSDSPPSTTKWTRTSPGRFPCGRGSRRDGEADEGRVVVEDAGECVVEGGGDVRRVGEGDALTALSRRVWAELET